MQGYVCPHCGYTKTSLEHQNTGNMFLNRHCGGTILFDSDNGDIECSHCHEKWSRLPPITCLKCKNKVR